MIKVGKEREITFDKSLRYKRQEQYDIQEYERVPVPFLEGRSVYKNFNLSIFVDDKCNADCQFCVAQLRYEHRGLLYSKEHITEGPSIEPKYFHNGRRTNHFKPAGTYHETGCGTRIQETYHNNKWKRFIPDVCRKTNHSAFN